MAKKQKQPWYDRLTWALAIGVLALAAAYGVGSRSLHTGSWQQYFMTLGLLILAVNRLVHVLYTLTRKGLARKGLCKA